MTTNGRVRFGDFEADFASGELRRAGTLVPLQDLPFRLLEALLERPGELITRTELTRRLWGSETYVDAAAGLNTAVGKLREALGDNAEQPIFIDTVPKRGYRFIGPIDSDDDPPMVIRPFTRPSPMTWSAALIAALAAGIFAAIMTASFVRNAGSGADSSEGRVRVAVVLFDNETGKPDNDPLAQGLTDATVTALTEESRLAVIGNAAVLRTARPFRDIAKVRDAVSADYIIIGQVQLLDGGVVVRAHLIRARDQAHVWVNLVRRAEASEAAFQSDVAGQIRAAVATHALATPTSSLATPRRDRAPSS